jgi:hypothetical protein
MKKTIVIFAAFALVFGFVGTTLAADWNFYGSSRVATFWTTADDESVNNTLPASVADPTKAIDDETDVTWNLQGNARIGATVSNGDVGGGFEYGTGVNVRKLYGTWNFGAGELLVGQTYTPTDIFLSNQVFAADNDLLGVGQFYNGRAPMLQLKFGGFKVALVTPVNGLAAVAGTGFTSVDTETMLPKLELSYKFSSDMFWVEPIFGYQTYDLVSATDASKSVDAWMLGAYAGVNFGPGAVKFGGYFAQNTGAYGAFQGYNALATLNGGNPVFAAGELQDNDEYGAVLVVTFTINDMFAVEGGFGYKNNTIDALGVEVETTNMSYYVNFPITLADGVFITPEIGVFDNGDLETNVAGIADVSQGQDTYFGAKWQINF